MFSLILEAYFGIFWVILVNKNIDAQLNMHVKNDHHHMSYFNLNYSIFSFKFVLCKHCLQKQVVKSHGVFIAFFWKSTHEDTHIKVYKMMINTKITTKRRTICKFKTLGPTPR
jgi:hypothetical protein